LDPKNACNCDPTGVDRDVRLDSFSGNGMKSWRMAWLALVGSTLFPSSGFGQAGLLGQLDPFSANSSGLHITNVTISSSYFLETVPGASSLGLPATTPDSFSSSMLQGSAAFGWSKATPKSSFSVNYAPSYLRTFHSSDYRSFNQSLGILATRKLGSKLSLSTSFQGILSDFDALLFAPTLYGGLSSVPSTLQELLSAMMLGQSANPALEELLAAAPVNGSPATAFLYGGRELSAAASISLTYAQSARSSFSFSVDGARTQFLNAAANGITIQPSSVIPETTTGNAILGWSYSLSPRTTVSIDASANRVFSRFEDEYVTELRGSLGRTLTPHWFVQGIFGTSYVMPLEQRLAGSAGSEPLYGGSIGYKFKAQTLAASYTRTAYDPYGLGAYSDDMSVGGWSWNRPGSSMSLSSSFVYTRMAEPAFPHVTSWSAQASFNRKIQAQLVMSATYSYVQYPERVFVLAPNVALSGVMVALSWSPSFRQ
jgi:hypothetical protein